MTIGLYPYHSLLPSSRLFPFRSLLGSDAAVHGVNVIPLTSREDIRNKKVNGIHIVGTDWHTYEVAMEIDQKNIPFVVSPMASSIYPMWIVRAIGSGGSITRRFSDLALGAILCSRAKYVVPTSERERLIIEEGFGIEKEKLTVIREAVDDRFVRTDPELFTSKFGRDRFILADAMGWEPKTNIFRFIQALEKINHPAVIFSHQGDSVYERQCRALAVNNPRVRIIDIVTEGADLYYSAFSACDVYVDVSPRSFDWLAVNAVAAGAKIVVSKTCDLKEYFGDDAEYIEPTSWELIHHGITTALNKPQSFLLPARIKEELSSKKTIEALQKIYHSMLR